MHVVEIIPALVWEHEDGRRASFHGATPFLSHYPDERAKWHRVQIGWTWKLDTGRVGLGCQAAATYGEAVEIANRINRKRIAQLEEHLDACAPAVAAARRRRLAEIRLFN